MKYYAVAEMNITDRGWIPEYVKNTTKLVEQYGGRYLARTRTFEKLEGERDSPQLYLIIEWPSKEASETFYNSPEYQPLRESRMNGSSAEFFLVAGEDMTGASTP